LKFKLQVADLNFESSDSNCWISREHAACDPLRLAAVLCRQLKGGLLFVPSRLPGKRRPANYDLANFSLRVHEQLRGRATGRFRPLCSQQSTINNQQSAISNQQSAISNLNVL
jgi:hypothetical protein